MPDFTLIHARWCITNEQDSKEIGGYKQQYNSANPGPYQFNWTCTCKGHQFRGQCKHIDQAEDKRCGFGWEASAGSPVVGLKGACPECGKTTIPVAVAV